ncbi:MAG: translation initiation factor IF-2 [Firmicutes bacterium]|nr:translation initiation factor IF-2 [Bacillota bacterium]
MAKIKIYELAKELSVESKDILRKLQKMNVLAKNHMSAINAKDADAIRQDYAATNAAPGQIVGPGGFIPRVKRIPKAVVEMEQAAVFAAQQPEQSEIVLQKPIQTAQSAELPEEGVSALAKTEALKSHIAEKPIEDEKPDIEKPIFDKTEVEMPKVEKPVLEKPAAEISAIGKSAIEKIALEKPAHEKSYTEKPQTEKPHTEKLHTEKLHTEKPHTEKPHTEKPHTEKPHTEKPYTEKPRTEKPRTEKPAFSAAGKQTQPRQDSAVQNRPPGQGAYGDRQRPTGQGQGRPPGQGSFSDRQRNQNTAPGRPLGTNQGRPPGQGGYYDKQRQQGAGQGRPPGQGGYGERARSYGAGQGRLPGANQGRAPGGATAGRPPGTSTNRPSGSAPGYPPGQGRPGGGRGGLSIPPPNITQEKPSNYRPPAAKKNYTKDQILDRADEGGRKRDFRPAKGRKDKGNRRKETKMVMPPVVPKKIMIGEIVILSELAHAMSKTAAEIIKKLFEMGIMATINQELDSETAILLADEYGITVEVSIDKAAEILEDIEDEAEELIERPPVVTIMGHVDHGKTSLLDAIRHTNVISTEAGGITQHIGAYQAEINGKKITFLDTPGHEAFTAMRARGAQITDIVIIVVAADDGVMPQTIEAINHSKAAGVPIIIAINKIDKPGANQDRVKQELTEHGLLAEEWGGNTIMVPVSAKGRQNIEGLLEMILLVAEVAELRANPNRQARGAVVESRLDKARGPVVTLLVQKGTLHIGDNLLAGPVFGKVRAMTDDKGRRVRMALPSTPVEVMGFSEVPSAGEVFISAKDDKDARFVAQRQQIKKREEELRKTARVSLDDLFKRIAEGEIKDLNLVVKTDVHGSAEALQQSLEKLNSETKEVRLNVIHSGVGGISESDVMLATASNAIIIGFNVRPMPAALRAAEHEQVDIRLYRVIYDAIEDIKKAMSGLLAPEFKEQIIGHAEVRAVFKVPKAGMIAGSYVLDGKMVRNAQVRLLRDSVVIADDKIDSLRRFKDDAKEVLSGFECGIGLENYNDVKEGDIIEAFFMEEIKRAL